MRRCGKPSTHSPQHDERTHPIRPHESNCSGHVARLPPLRGTGTGRRSKRSARRPAAAMLRRMGYCIGPESPLPA
jgi:hypothetical protein